MRLQGEINGGSKSLWKGGRENEKLCSKIETSKNEKNIFGISKMKYEKSRTIFWDGKGKCCMGKDDFRREHGE